MNKNLSTWFHFDVPRVPQPKSTFGKLLKLYILIDRKTLLKQPYSKLYNLIFWNQILIAKSIPESGQNLIRNLNRSRKNHQNIRGFMIYRVQTKIPIGKGSILFRGGGFVGTILFEFSNFLKIKPRIKTSVWMIQMTWNLQKRKISIR